MRNTHLRPQIICGIFFYRVTKPATKELAHWGIRRPLGNASLQVKYIASLYL